MGDVFDRVLYRHYRLRKDLRIDPSGKRRHYQDLAAFNSDCKSRGYGQPCVLTNLRRLADGSALATVTAGTRGVYRLHFGGFSTLIEHLGGRVSDPRGFLAVGQFASQVSEKQLYYRMWSDPTRRDYSPASAAGLEPDLVVFDELLQRGMPVRGALPLPAELERRGITITKAWKTGGWGSNRGWMYTFWPTGWPVPEKPKKRRKGGR
jgi:hypothetical protein